MGAQASRGCENGDYLHVSYSKNSSKGVYMGDYSRLVQGDAGSLDYSSCDGGSKLLC